MPNLDFTQLSLNPLFYKVEDTYFLQIGLIELTRIVKVSKACDLKVEFATNLLCNR